MTDEEWRQADRDFDDFLADPRNQFGGFTPSEDAGIDAEIEEWKTGGAASEGRSEGDADSGAEEDSDCWTALHCPNCGNVLPESGKCQACDHDDGDDGCGCDWCWQHRL